MSNQEAKYFDLLTTGLGYINRIREVTPEEGNPFLSVTLAALRGSADNAQYTHFECRVAGKQAKAAMLELQAAVEGDHKVLVGFTLSDLYAEAFTYKKGEKAGQTGISLKARLLRIGWAKVDGERIEIEQAAA
ncbi:MAG: DUF3577 domain-containing protein [Pseudomonadota bacterium]|nr:DUF3577 domain-containing protein [Pseudomonadota bacterium]